MHGSYGKYLDVDLSAREIREYRIPEEWSTRFLGGKGIAARLLLEELPDRIDPFGPENLLVFATGPFQGTGLAGAGRHVVMAVSPKTGYVADSYAGGYFGHELGRTGYDGILVRGISATPVVLALIDGSGELIPADDLWGVGTAETEGQLTTRYPKARVSSIGIAGERLVSQSCIINDRNRSAGRPGLGAVMGSKRLKAVVVRGNLEKPLADPDRFASERADYARELMTEGMQGFGEYGTANGTPYLSDMGILPTKNFQEGAFDLAEQIGGERMHDTILVGRDTCAGCPVRCKRAVKTTFGGRDVLPEYGGPEYETVAALGSLCLNGDLDSIALANQICNDVGLDTISAGTSIAFMMEASEKRLLDETIEWGDAHAVIRLVEQMASREGLGAKVADGLEPFARSLGADFAMTIKGVELPMHEPRGKQGMGLSYATSPRGATHMEGLHDTMLAMDHPNPEIGVDRSYDRFSLPDKPEPSVAFENLRSFDNSMILCAFTMQAVGPANHYPHVRSLLERVTGRSVGADEMQRIGARNYALMRILSARAGHRMSHDGLPPRFAEALTKGGSADHPVDPAELQAAIAACYEIRGYDEFGPTDETLISLGMEDCAGRIPRE